jgi:hypothetical protein
MKFGFATRDFQRKSVVKKLLFFYLICLIRTISCPSVIIPNMPVSRVQKTIASPLLTQFLTKTSAILAVLDILYGGEEVGLAPLYFAILLVGSHVKEGRKRGMGRNSNEAQNEGILRGRQCRNVNWAVIVVRQQTLKR